MQIMMLPLHSFVSQVSSSVSSGQAAPPCFASCATPLDLDLLVLAPLLVQITLHLLHDDQSSTLQSTEPSHWSVLQGSSSSKAGQTAPPFSASWTTPLPLVLVPPPQVALQSDHEDQSSTLQSTAGKYFKSRWDRDDGRDYDNGKGCDNENGDHSERLSADIFSFNSSANLSLFMYLTTWCPHMMNVDFEII